MVTMSARRSAEMRAACWLSIATALLAGAVSAEVVAPSRPAVKSHRFTTSTNVDVLEAINARLDRQQQLIDRQAAQISDLERVTPKEFEIVHYNVLADQSSSNLQPWFCYGANVTVAERAELTRRFYSGDKRGYKDKPNKGWPAWAIGVLSDERRRKIEEYDRDYFAWERRRERLWHEVREHSVGCRRRSPDLVTLAECDHYEDFWASKLRSGGYDSVWRARPRQSARDGSAVAWRTSTWELEASGGFDFGRSLHSKHDRTCLFVLLRWRRDPTARLLIATTHLARNPDDVEQQMARGFQYGTIFRELLAFAAANGAVDVPVVLTGDLNAKDCDELAGIARALVRLTSAPTHPMLWSLMDAPTPVTTVTEERSLRIDYVMYQSTAMQLRGVSNLPELSSPIPDATHPSDHLPVSARLLIRPSWAQVEDDARQWLACVAGTRSVRPISPTNLRHAFTYFDKDGSGLVSLVQLEAALQTLGFPGLDSTQVRQALIDVGCTTSAGERASAALRTAGARRDDDKDGTPADAFPSGVGAGRGGQPSHPDHQWLSTRDAEERTQWAMDLDQFIQVYTHSVQRSSSANARQLDMAFAAFDTHGEGVLGCAEFREALHRMASAPLDERQVDKVMSELDDGDGTISLTSFSRWMMRTYTSFLEDPSLVHDKAEDAFPDHVYNQ